MKVKKLFIAVRTLAAGIMMVLLMACIVAATSSTTYWTPMTPDIQPFGVLHIGVDNYFTINKSARAGAGSLPTDVGLTMGILPLEKLQMEVGIDYLEPQNWVPSQFTVSPYSFNAKLGCRRMRGLKSRRRSMSAILPAALHTTTYRAT